MKVSVDVLRRVYESLRDQGEAASTEKEFLDPDSHLYFIDAFDMPLWHWSSERGTFEKCAARSEIQRRYLNILQTHGQSKLLGLSRDEGSGHAE